MQARQTFSGFNNLDEVVISVPLTSGQEAMLRDKGVVLPL